MADQATGLHPTKTRLGLLKAVAQDDVFRWFKDGEDYQSLTAKGPDLKVTSRIAELEQAGWVELGRPGDVVGRPWRTTTDGYAVLAEHVPGWEEPC